MQGQSCELYDFYRIYSLVPFLQLLVTKIKNFPLYIKHNDRVHEAGEMKHMDKQFQRKV